MSQPAWIYARFSTLEQSKGHSLERQLTDGRAYIEDMGWEYSADREIVDESRSAFKGSNRSAGSGLHDFEEKVRAGHLGNGAVLVVENLDRLTRQGYEEAFDLLRFLTSNGVTVSSWHDGQIYQANQRIDMTQVLSVILKAELAHEESDKKSKRLTASWAKKIGAVQAGERTAMTKIMPGWLIVEPETRKIVEHPHRGPLLRQLYEWYCEGKSLPWIVATLNERGEPTWGKGKQAQGKGWNVSTLHKYLTGRAVLGEYKPQGRDAKDGKVSKGFVVPDYYPQVVDTDVYNRVQVLRTQRKKWGGRSSLKVPNLFSNIAMCSQCGGRMHFASQTAKRAYIRCGNAMRKFGCTNRKLHRYGTLEQSVLDLLFDLATRKNAFQPSSAEAALIKSIAEQERQIDLRRDQLAQLVDNLMLVSSKAVAQKVADLETQIEDDEAELALTKRDLEFERGNARPEDNLNQLVAEREALASTDAEIAYEARVKAHQSLKLLIDQMICRGDGETHISLKDSSVHIVVDYDGNQRAIFYEGPEGEDNWHPDDAFVDA